MQFTLKLDLPDAEQEAVWLQDYLREAAIPGLESELVKRPQASGAMSGEIWTELISLVATAAAGKVIELAIAAVYEHFKGKKATLELSGQCPDNGQQFKLTFETNGPAARAAAIAEYRQLMAELCGQPEPPAKPNDA